MSGDFSEHTDRMALGLTRRHYERFRRCRIIRVLWGKTARHDKIQSEVKRLDLVNCHPFTAYVFGSENRDLCESLGIPTVCLSKHPHPLCERPEDIGWNHKLVAWREAMRTHDEILHLDWDIRTANSPPGAAWLFQTLWAKSPFQANLLQYKRNKCRWRDCDTGKQPSAAVVYCRNVSLLDRMIEVWESGVMRKFPIYGGATEETVMAYVLDEINGGWQGVAHWERRHEPVFCWVRKSGVTPEFRASKRTVLVY